MIAEGGSARLKSASRVLGWNALLLICVVVVTELVFGTWFFGDNFGFLNISRNVEIRHDLSKIAPGGGVGVYRRDKYGFRGDYGVPSDIDLLVIGGSTTDELYVGDGEIWTDVMASALARAGKKLHVANAGVNGHSSIGHLASMKWWLPRVPGLKPRYGLFYVGINDLVVEGQAMHDDIRPDDLSSRVRFAIHINSALYHLFRTIRGIVRAHRVRVVHGAERGAMRPVGPVPVIDRAPYADRLDAYTARLRALNDLTLQRGARPIFVTQRTGEIFLRQAGNIGAYDKAPLRRALLNLFNEVTLSVCRDVKGICIDLAADLRMEPGDFYDNVHTLPSGSRKIGEYLAAKLKDIL